MDATIVIPTYNRAPLLGQTLRSLAAMRVEPGCRWEIVLVDNNSTDNTRLVVAKAADDFPVPLRYVFEPRQGRSNAVNRGIAESAAPLVFFTDDDVRVSEEWLAAGLRAFAERPEIAYLGGPVRPIWEAPRPRWLDEARGDLWGSIAILDYGPAPFVFEEQRKVPVGANMAVRRALIDRIGGCRPDLGRTKGRLLMGQEIPELLARARAAGARGLYVPAMSVDHHVPATRLRKSYFRRWWFGKGVSRAVLDRIQPVTELGLALTEVPHIAGIPRFIFGSALRNAGGFARYLVAADPAGRFRHEARLCFLAGYAWGRLRERGTGTPPPAGVIARSSS